MLGEGATSAGPFAGKPIDHLAGRLVAATLRGLQNRHDAQLRMAGGEVALFIGRASVIPR